MAVNYEKIPGYLKDEPKAKREVKSPSEIVAEIATIPKNPKSGERKKPVTMRLDPDVLEFFKATGMGWQTKINQILRSYMSMKSGGEK